MNWYPQIGAGSVAQFPLGRKRKWRPITNWLENDERVLLADAASKEIEWTLGYQELNAAEVSGLRELFDASRGSFRPFGFVDPLANLLGWSGDLLKPDWEFGLLGAAGGAADPMGGDGAWVLSNAQAGELRLVQSVAIPGAYNACFSVWLSSEAGAVVRLSRDGNEKSFVVGPKWTRCYVNGTGAGESAEFAIKVPAARSVRVWGLQVESQPYPGQYKATSAARGIYEETYFRDDELKVTATGPGLYNCDVALISRG